APDVVSFDINPPLRYAGANKKRQAWLAAFALYSGGFSYAVSELDVTAQGELAFVLGPLDGVPPAHRRSVGHRARPRLRPGRPRARTRRGQPDALSAPSTAHDQEAALRVTRGTRGWLSGMRFRSTDGSAMTRPPRRSSSVARS